MYSCHLFDLVINSNRKCCIIIRYLMTICDNRYLSIPDSAGLAAASAASSPKEHRSLVSFKMT